VLTELHIENLGVIERVELVLGPGLTAVTGETGAGKTMIVEAIELLVGGRADATMVRSGAAEARVDGRFVIGDEPGNEIVLTRVVPADGRSRAYIDGRLATAGSLGEIAERIVDLHGQHAHQSLLGAATQRAALDRYGEVDLAPLRAARAAVTEIDAELAALGGDERSRAREIDLLRYQVDELDSAALASVDEDTDLDREEAVLADAVAHREAGARALAALTSDGGGRDVVGEALAALSDRAPYDALSTRLRDALAELDDIASELRTLSDAIDEDPERLEQIRLRRQRLHDLCRKYGDDLAEVMAFHASAQARLAELRQFDQRAAELDRERGIAVARERDAARVVGERRREVAPRLADAVEARLRELAMGHAAVAVEVGESPDDHPGDRVQFLLAANPGAPLLPLSRVASGGELARAMLALRLVLTVAASGDADGTGDGEGVAADRRTAENQTLVFDEVDAGIGGTAAVAVGEALAALAADHQVLVVTHLPQVAALARTQIVVTKDVREGQTFASVAPLDGERRVDELARMLSGSTDDAALEHARELLRPK
jgi:DNA repair protein RecN (Recombination protein N)